MVTKAQGQWEYIYVWKLTAPHTAHGPPFAHTKKQRGALALQNRPNISAPEMGDSGYRHTIVAKP
jgi:hypothetical protein